MKISVLVILIFFINIVIGQNIQTYKGYFENGTAIYQYYENEKQERIYHGSFEYEKNGNIFLYDVDYVCVFKIIGKFNNNLRDDLWEYTVLEDGKIRYSVKGNYSNGKMDGPWDFTFNKNNSNIIGKIISFKVNFNNNIFTNDFYFFGYDYNLNFFAKITGKLNNNGKCDGTWVIKYSAYEDNREYKNGFLISRILKNIQNGDIIKNENFNNDYLKLNDSINYILEDDLSFLKSPDPITSSMYFWTQNSYSKITLDRSNTIYEYYKGIDTTNFYKVPFSKIEEYNKSNKCLATNLNKLSQEYDNLYVSAKSEATKKNYSNSIELYKKCMMLNNDIATLKIDILRKENLPSNQFAYHYNEYNKEAENKNLKLEQTIESVNKLIRIQNENIQKEIIQKEINKQDSINESLDSNIKKTQDYNDKNQYVSTYLKDSRVKNKSIIQAYMEIYKEIMSDLNSNINREIKIKKVETLLSLQKKIDIDLLFSEGSKELEKIIRNLDTNEEKINAILNYNKSNN